MTCFCSQPIKIFRPHSDQTIQKTLVFRQAGFQSVSSPFSARLLLLYQAKTLRARTIPPATQAIRIGVGSFDGVRDFNTDLCKNIETTSVCSIAFNQKSDVVEFFIWGGEGSFMGGNIEVFFGGGGKVLGGKVQSPESRVQSPESRVQSSF